MKILVAITGACVLLTPLFVSIGNKDAVCTGVVINLADSTQHRFVTTDDLMELIRSTGIQVTGSKMNEIPLTAIEKKVKDIQGTKGG